MIFLLSVFDFCMIYEDKLIAYDQKFEKEDQTRQNDSI